jgi:hypothetical protein
MWLIRASELCERTYGFNAAQIQPQRSFGAICTKNYSTVAIASSPCAGMPFALLLCSGKPLSPGENVMKAIHTTVAILITLSAIACAAADADVETPAAEVRGAPSAADEGQSDPSKPSRGADAGAPKGSTSDASAPLNDAGRVDPSPRDDAALPPSPDPGPGDVGTNISCTTGANIDSCTNGACVVCNNRNCFGCKEGAQETACADQGSCGACKPLGTTGGGCVITGGSSDVVCPTQTVAKACVAGNCAGCSIL